MSMACLRVRDLLPEFALDVLDPAGAREVERHLSDCAGCRKEAEEFREGAARLALGLPAIEPSADLGERVVHGVAALRPHRAEPPGGRHPSRRTVRVIAAAGLAAAILAAGSVSWALSMRDQVATVRHAADQRAQTVKKLEQFIKDFQHNFKPVRPQPTNPADASRFFGALLASPAPGGGSGELLVFSIPGNSPDFVHMQVNLPSGAKGPFRVLFEQRTGEAIKAGGLVKTPNGDYVLTKDPRFFDLDLSHLTGVVVLDKSGATLLTGSIQLLSTPTT
jgi:Putative zinc-finger